MQLAQYCEIEAVITKPRLELRVGRIGLQGFALQWRQRRAVLQRPRRTVFDDYELCRAC